jgi:hypothetical protein
MKLSKLARMYADTETVRRAAVPCVVGAILALYAMQGNAAQTYYIDEATDYTGNGCPNNDLNTVTATLQSAMISDGWTGERWVNGDAWPQDFLESCSSTYGTGGLDGSYSDTKSLAVFAGHGNVGRLAYGYKHDNRCTVDFSSNMRLGSMGGDTAAVGMWLICDALQVASLPSEANFQWLRQQLGWTNTIAIGDNEPRDFFNLTSAQTNADAWLSTMDGGGRHPIVVSYAANQSDCWTVHDNAKLKDNVYTSERSGSPACGQGQPAFWYCYETI